jgi:hypothetical protein
MATVRLASLKSASRRKAGLAADFADLLRMLKTLCDPYRPELHYMRGPGPKWHAKHAQAPARDASALPALVRVKA